MTVTAAQLVPTAHLPHVRRLRGTPQEDLLSALASLRLVYCPIVPSTAAFQRRTASKSAAPPPQVDSGYVSGDDAGGSDDSDDHGEDALARLRADSFERDFAFRWLTSLILRADELQVESDEAREQLVEDASGLLASLTVATESGSVCEEGPEEDHDCGITRDFTFEVATQGCRDVSTPLVTVRLFDAALTASDHASVGLQSWGASIIFSELLCASPAQFGFTKAALGSSPRIVELGAGTGLVSIVLAQLLPTIGVSSPEILATDYHPVVLDNLAANIAANGQDEVQVAQLDWSDPVRRPPLDEPADVLVATDVVYAPEHAVWLRDCAFGLLRREGTFWLVATVRPAGKFEEMGNTVEDAFGTVDGGCNADGLRILESKMLDKKKGVGRGNEIGYRLFKIGWA